MEKEHSYLRCALLCIIGIIALTVGYGFYINKASDAHTAKMMAAQYAVVTAARTEPQDVRATLAGVNISVKTIWKIDVQAQTEGVLRQIRAAAGQRVHAGDVLAVIENQEIAAQLAQADGAIKQAKANLISAEQELHRYTMLAAQGAASKQQYDDAAAAREVAAGQLDSAVAQKELYLTRRAKEIVTAPRDADVLNVYCRSGYHVRSGEAILMLGEMSKMYFTASLSDRDIQKLQPLDQPFDLQIELHLLAHKSYPILNMDAKTQSNRFPITFMQVAPPLGQAAKFRVVTWSVDNHSGFLEPTTYQNATLIARKPRRTLAIPTAAAGDLDNPRVLLVDGLSRLQARDISVGIYDDRCAEVLAGLKEGDLVVTSGRVGLKDGMKVRVKYE